MDGRNFQPIKNILHGIHNSVKVNSRPAGGIPEKNIDRTGIFQSFSPNTPF